MLITISNIEHAKFPKNAYIQTDLLVEEAMKKNLSSQIFISGTTSCRGANTKWYRVRKCK